MSNQSESELPHRYRALTPPGGPKEHLVFVYGSLKIGFGNFKYFLDDSEFVGRACTVDPAFEMVSLGMFPAVVKGGDNSIYGELFMVDQHTFERLDMLESNGDMYLREQFFCVDMDGKVRSAWMYCFIDHLTIEERQQWSSKREDIEVFDSQCGFDVQSWTYRGYKS